MRKLYAILLCSIAAMTGRAQYTTTGSTAVITPNTEFQLTSPTVTTASGQSGGVWKTAQVNLASPFTLNVQLNFGVFNESNPDLTNPNGSPWNTGADGIAFVLAPAPYVGNQGEDIGYGTTNQVNGSLVDVNSFAAEFDTWFNGANLGFTIKNDILADHMAFMRRGNSFHGVGTNTTPIVPLPEIETGSWIPVTVTWDPITGMTVNFNGITMSTSAADVMTALGGNTMANWGFTGGTALGSNDQRVRFPAPPPPPSCTPGNTVTQGGWGAVARGNNPGTYLNANFGTAFPSGVTVGVSGHSAKWTSATAVRNFLPAGGTANVLPAGNSTNPTSTSGGVVVGQVLALSLNVGFDAADPNFSPSGTLLSDMIIASGTFAGWTVGQFLTVANNVLGGASSAYTAVQINTTATAINENFDNGANNGFLTCPGTQQVSRMAPDVDVKPTTVTDNNLSVYPNPSRGQVQLGITSMKNAEVQIINSKGILVERRIGVSTQNLSLDLKKYGTGIYVIKVISGSSIKTSKVLVQD